MEMSNDHRQGAGDLLPQQDSPAMGEQWLRCWMFRRNCSIAPRQLVVVYLSLCVVSLMVAGMAWDAGGALVAPFTGLELLAVAAALLMYARHATDHECLRLSADSLHVEWENAGTVESVQFNPRWVRLSQPERGLIELSSSGRTAYIGRFMRPERREVILRDLRAALRAI